MASMQGSQEPSGQIRPIQFLAVGNQSQVPAPLIRITTCGLLSIEVVAAIVSTDPPLARYVPLTPEQLRGRGTAPALTLLKLLLSRPERFALKEWLTEQFCRDRELFSNVRLDNIVSLLRGVLCPPAYEALRTHLVAYVRSSPGGGDGYQLATSPLIWVDSEALAWYVEQAARLERFGDEALPYWERAYALAKRGTFFPDEVYTDWSAPKRGDVAGLLRQSVQALARLYLARHGAAGEEEAVLLLRSYWQHHLHEEDVLRQLMELLGRREQYHEALEDYKRLVTLLEQEEHQPDKQTQDLAEYVREKHVQRRSPQNVVKQVIIEECKSIPHQVVPPSAVLSFQTSDMLYLPHSRKDMSVEVTQQQKMVTTNQTSLVNVDLFTIGIRALMLHQQQQQWNSNEFHMRIAQALDEWLPEMHNDPQTSRREVLKLLAGIPLALYGFARVSGQPASVLVPEEVIPLYTAGIPACWRLYYEGGQLELEETLPVYRSHLLTLAHISSNHQKHAAGLLSQTYQLMALLVQDREDFGKAIEYCKQAVLYGQLADDPNLQAMALIRQQDTFFVSKRFSQWFLTLKEAETFADSITPLLRGRIYARLALASAHQSQMQAALQYSDLAQNTFPDNPEADPGYLYSHTTPFILHANQALVFMKMGHFENAWEALITAENHVSGPTNPRKIEVLSYQLQAAIGLGNMELSCQLFEHLALFSMQFGKAIDIGNTHDMYQLLSTQWPYEKSVQQLHAHLHI